MTDPLLLEVLVALGAGNLTIGPIHCEDESQYVQGYAITGKGKGRGHVRLNPAREMVDTAIHELIHRLRPKWSERKVRSQTRRLLRDLSDRDVDVFYGLILSVAETRKRPAVVDIA